MSSHNFITTVKKLATIETLVDGVMLTFAIASVGNVSTYMATNGHNPLTSYTVGAALGLGLVAVSVMLARVDMEDKRTFASMLASTVALGLLSGAVQCLAYLEHVSNPWVAVLMGFGFPLCGEALLALSMAFYTASERRRRARQADDGMEERINTAISDALSTIDISSAAKYIERQAAAIVRAKMDEIVARRVGASSHTTPTERTESPADVQPVIEQSGGNGECASVLDTGRQIAIERRRGAKVERQRNLLNILQQEFNGSPTDALNKSALAERLGVKHTTISRDIEELQAAQRLSVNGHIEVLSW